MELIRIDEEKLKMILSHEDLLEFEMEESELDYTNTETKRMFWELLRRAKQSTGFDTDGHRVLVQLYPSREGGCEIFVTRLGILCHDCDFNYEEYEEEEEDDVNFSEKVPHRRIAQEKRSAAFGFDDLDDLLKACRRLLAKPYRGKSSVYHSEEGRYYLFLDLPDPSDPWNPSAPDEFSFLNEYGTSERSDLLGAYLPEHATLLCPKDAISRLGVL